MHKPVQRLQASRRAQSNSVVCEYLEPRRLLANVFAVDVANNLLRFDSAAPNAIGFSAPITGLLPGEQIVAIDFRPATSQLYGLAVSDEPIGPNTGRIYLISTATGAATTIEPTPFTNLPNSAIIGVSYGFDFNPVTDRIRIVNSTGQSFHVNPDTGLLSNEPGGGGLDQGLVVAAAYDRNDQNPATPTTLFGLLFSDARDLVRIGNVDNPAANAGTVTKLNQFAVDFSTSQVGFDIADNGTAFASAPQGGPSIYGLYTVNLATGDATRIGDIGNGTTTIRGISVQPATPAFDSLVVTNTADSGPGSLRHAIILARHLPGRDIITFNIPGDGPHTIAPQSDLPSVPDETGIDGIAQPGSVANTDPLGNNAVMKVRIHGGGTLTRGLVFGNNGGMRGLVVSGFTDFQVGLLGENISIGGCFIGTNIDGTAAGSANQGAGIHMGPDARRNNIGFGTPDGRNVISGNNVGIRARFTGSSNNISGNIIGADRTGTSAVPNIIGIELVEASFMQIGGSPGSPGGLGNLISGNGDEGIRIALGSGHRIEGNFIGTNFAGRAALRNGSNGITILASNDNEIRNNVIAANGANGVEIRAVQAAGGASGNILTGNSIGASLLLNDRLGNASNGVLIAGVDADGAVQTAVRNVVGDRFDQNFITFNGGAGVRITGAASVQNAVRGNALFNNAGLEIDLGLQGITSNDLLDADSGPNTLLNFPLLATAVSTDGVGVRVTGNYNSKPLTAFELDIHYSLTAEPGGQGSAMFSLGTVQVTTDASGNATFDELFENAPVPAGGFMSATASTANVNDSDTSEFGPAIPVTGNVASFPPPDAVDDVFVRGIAQSLDLDVTENDAGGLGAGFNVTVLTQPVGGTVTVNPTNPEDRAPTLRYTPNPGFNGDSSFTYRVTPAAGGALEGNSDTATVFLNTSGAGLDIDPQFEDGVTQALFVAGTDGNDVFKFRNRRGMVEVLINGVVQGDPLALPGGSLYIYGRGGNDVISAGPLKGIAGRFFGGDGNDVIKGTKLADIIVGGAGDDTINSGVGNDVVIAGDGADRVNGAAGDDLLVAGSTDYDAVTPANTDALRDLHLAWTAAVDYVTRIGQITSAEGVGVSEARLTAATLLDDSARDTLTGASGTDAFFANLSGGIEDLLKGRQSTESAIDDG